VSRPLRVWVPGHRGMLGSALVRRLAREPVEILVATREELDLLDAAAVSEWTSRERPDWVMIAAARVGGILANRDHPGEFIRENLAIASNIIHAAYEAGVAKLVHVASSAIYPREAAQPIAEDAQMTGTIDAEHVPYSVAKIAGITMCSAYRRQYGCDFISAVPTNLYGPGDNFDPISSHVVPAIIRKVDAAKHAKSPEIVVWGTGNPRREFLHVDDLADALFFLMGNYSGETHINIGYGDDVTILELTRLVCDVVGYDGAIVHDLAKPDGTARKLLDSTRLQALGWGPSIELRQGLEETYKWYRAQA
jgi:GDP-L-fucose synthase